MPKSETGVRKRSRKPLARREAGMRVPSPGEQQARCEESKSQLMPRGEKDVPADRGACEPEATVQGSE
jgi:hypothetical protein